MVNFAHFLCTKIKHVPEAISGSFENFLASTLDYIAMQIRKRIREKCDLFSNNIQATIFLYSDCLKSCQ